MSENPSQRFIVRCEVVVTTEYDLDGLDVGEFFTRQVMQNWDAVHDLDFERLNVSEVIEVEPDDYEFHMRQFAEAVKSICRASEQLRALDAESAV